MKSRTHRLTGAQRRMLIDLSEPNKNPRNVWYYPTGKSRTGDVLVRLGLAEVFADGMPHRIGYALTQRGIDSVDRLFEGFAL